MSWRTFLWAILFLVSIPISIEGVMWVGRGLFDSDAGWPREKMQTASASLSTPEGEADHQRSFNASLDPGVSLMRARLSSNRTESSAAGERGSAGRLDEADWPPAFGATASTDWADTVREIPQGSSRSETGIRDDGATGEPEPKVRIVAGEFVGPAEANPPKAVKPEGIDLAAISQMTPDQMEAAIGLVVALRDPEAGRDWLGRQGGSTTRMRADQGIPPLSAPGVLSPPGQELGRSGQNLLTRDWWAFRDESGVAWVQLGDDEATRVAVQEGVVLGELGRVESVVRSEGRLVVTTGLGGSIEGPTSAVLPRPRPQEGQAVEPENTSRARGLLTAFRPAGGDGVESKIGAKPVPAAKPGSSGDDVERDGPHVE